jgi:hypothetical protein
MRNRNGDGTRGVYIYVRVYVHSRWQTGLGRNVHVLVSAGDCRVCVMHAWWHCPMRAA